MPGERTETTFRRAVTVSTYFVISGVALLTVFPSLVCPEGDPVLIQNIALVGTYSGVLFALAMSVFPLSRYFKSSPIPEPVDILDTYRLSKSLWVFVFSFGTAAAIIAYPIKPQTNAIESLSQLGPRLFVSWFLSILTMVATRLLGHLESLGHVQVKLDTTLKGAQQVVLSMERGRQRTEEAAERTIETAAESVDLLDEYSHLKVTESKMREEGLGTEGSSPTQHFVKAAKSRVHLMNKIATAAQERVNSDHSPCGRFLRSKVLLPALVPYLATDPWRQEAGISIVQEGSYLLYSQFIEAIFREVMQVSREDGESCFRSHFPEFCIEIFTTLDVPPSHFYNVIGPRSPIGRAKKRVRFDSGKTEEDWERYRAMQAAAIAIGKPKSTSKKSGCLALTRCFVTTSSDSQLDDEINQSFVPRKNLKVHDDLVKAFSTVSGTLSKVSEQTWEAFKAGLEGFEIQKWVQEITEDEALDPVVRGACQALGDRGNFYSYPIVIEHRQGIVHTDSLDRTKWYPLPLHFMDTYLSSPSRGLRIDDPHGALKLPKDVFAVGWSESHFSDRPPSDWQAAFIVTLEVDLSGTQTRTTVITPSDQSYKELVMRIRQLSLQEEIPYQHDGGFEMLQSVPLFNEDRLKEFSSWDRVV